MRSFWLIWQLSSSLAEWWFPSSSFSYWNSVVVHGFVILACCRQCGPHDTSQLTVQTKAAQYCCYYRQQQWLPRATGIKFWIRHSDHLDRSLWWRAPAHLPIRTAAEASNTISAATVAAMTVHRWSSSRRTGTIRGSSHVVSHKRQALWLPRCCLRRTGSCVGRSHWLVSSFCAWRRLWIGFAFAYPISLTNVWLYLQSCHLSSYPHARSSTSYG